MYPRLDLVRPSPEEGLAQACNGRPAARGAQALGARRCLRTITSAHARAARLARYRSIKVIWPIGSVHIFGSGHGEARRRPGSFGEPGQRCRGEPNAGAGMRDQCRQLPSARSASDNINGSVWPYKYLVTYTKTRSDARPAHDPSVVSGSDALSLSEQDGSVTPVWRLLPKI